MKTITIPTAKKQLSRLIDQVCVGEEIVIVRGKVPVVRLVPVAVAPRPRRFGVLRGRARVGPDFFAPLPPYEMTAWER